MIDQMKAPGTVMSVASQVTIPNISNLFPLSSNSSQQQQPQQQSPFQTINNNKTRVDHGNANGMNLSQLPELRQRIRRQVDSVIRQTFNHETSAAAYLQAMQCNADLVQTETDPLQFVRYCNYDLWAGAQRLCLYWTERLALFGPQRAFLPMTLTGQGALTKEDISTIQAGFPAILQFSSDKKDNITTTTGEKRQFVLVDGRNWIPGATRENKLRAFFYVYSVLAQDDQAQAEGIRTFILAVAPRHESLDWTFVQRAVYCICSVFPVRMRAIHFLSIPNHKRPFRPVDVVNVAVQVFGRFISLPHVQTHIQTQPGQILHELLELGLHKREIPLSFGGEWKIDDWYAWCQKRKEEHVEKYGSTLSHLSGREILTATGTLEQTSSGRAVSATMTNSGDAPDSRKRGNPSSSTAATPSGHQQQVDERLAKRRMADLLHSRRKRERGRQEMALLQQESESLIQENQQLKAKKARLEQFLAQAQEIVGTLTGHDNDGNGQN